MAQVKVVAAYKLAESIGATSTVNAPLAVSHTHTHTHIKHLAHSLSVRASAVLVEFSER